MIVNLYANEYPHLCISLRYLLSNNNCQELFLIFLEQNIKCNTIPCQYLPAYSAYKFFQMLFYISREENNTGGREQYLNVYVRKQNSTYIC